MKRIIYFAFLVLTFSLVSCSTPKKVVYFQDAVDSTSVAVSQPEMIRFMPEDKLSIIVNSKDPQLMNLFNKPYYTKRIGYTTDERLDYAQGVSGYIVDGNGDINFPVLGKLHIAGMTRPDVEMYIQNQLIAQNLVLDPTVTCEFVNLQVTVMGEVMKPGRVQIDHDSFTLADALSAAGDLQIFARRDNVKVMRKENGFMNTYEVNLTSSKDLLSSPVFYLKQNDIVYVTPNDMRTKQSTINGNTLLSASFWISLASLTATILTAVSVLRR